MATKPPLLTVREVAEELHLSPPTIRRLADSGQLPAVRIGSTTLRFRREDLDRLLTPGNAVVVRVEENGDQ